MYHLIFSLTVQVAKNISLLLQHTNKNIPVGNNISFGFLLACLNNNRSCFLEQSFDLRNIRWGTRQLTTTQYTMNLWISLSTHHSMYCHPYPNHLWAAFCWWSSLHCSFLPPSTATGAAALLSSTEAFFEAAHYILSSLSHDGTWDTCTSLSSTTADPSSLTDSSVMLVPDHNIFQAHCGTAD